MCRQSRRIEKRIATPPSAARNDRGRLKDILLLKLFAEQIPQLSTFNFQFSIFNEIICLYF